MVKKRKLIFLYIDVPDDIEMGTIIGKFQTLCATMTDYQFVITNRQIQSISKEELIKILEKVK